MNVLPVEDYMRVKDLSSMYGGHADVNIKWLWPALAEDIQAYYAADEEAVDNGDMRYLKNGRATLGGDFQFWDPD